MWASGPVRFATHREPVGSRAGEGPATTGPKGEPMMMRTVRVVAAAGLFTGAIALLGAGCSREEGKGPAETVGKKIDSAAEATKDAAAGAAKATGDAAAAAAGAAKDAAVAAGTAAKDATKATGEVAKEAAAGAAGTAADAAHATGRALDKAAEAAK